MRIVQDHEPGSDFLAQLPELDDCFVGEAAAANDAGVAYPAGSSVADVNDIVAGTVGRLSALAITRDINIELSLTTSSPVVAVAPSDLAFALAAVLSAHFRSLEGSDQGLVRVETRMHAGMVDIVVVGDELPLLRFVRAVTEDTGLSASHDPTMAHCRRIVEERGGRLSLTDRHGLIGFRLSFPPLLHCRPLRLSRPGARALPSSRPYRLAIAG